MQVNNWNNEPFFFEKPFHRIHSFFLSALSVYVTFCAKLSYHTDFPATACVSDPCS